MLLLVAIGAIALEAVRRLQTPEPVDTGVVFWVAGIGVLINGGTALMFMRGREHDLNVRGAFLHMAADAGITVGVMAAALVIAWTGWLWLDPAVSLIIAAVILVGTWSLLRDWSIWPWTPCHAASIRRRSRTISPASRASARSTTCTSGR